MSATLGDMMTVLVAQIAKVNDPETTGDQLKEQLERSRVVVAIAGKMIDTGRLALDAQKSVPDLVYGAKIPTQLRMDNDQ